MNLKITIATFVFSLCTTSMLAQYEGTTLHDRFGTGQDSIDCLNDFALFRTEYRNKSYTEAYEPWKNVFTKAPVADLSIYTIGAALLQQLIYSETDEAKKKQYYSELMTVYDQRIKYMNELNSFATDRTRFTKGVVICRKAFDYATYAPTLEPTYSLDKAYEMFTEGINLVNQDETQVVEGFVLYKYFDVSYLKYKTDVDGFREQFLNDYLLCKEVCERMLSMANLESDSTKAQQIVSQYDPTLYRVENTFAMSKAADRDQLINIFTPKIEERKNDLAYLKSALRILASNDCDDTDIYFQTAKYAYDLEPSFESAIGLAKSYEKQNNTAESVEYYDKAISLCTTDEMKARIAIVIARNLGRVEHYEKSYSYLDKAISFDESTSGRCNLQRAQSLAAQEKFGEATNFASLAAKQDASISGKASRLIEAIQKVQKQRAENEKAQKEYDEKKKKQQQMEDFWNSK